MERLQGLLFAYIFTLLANLIIGLIQYHKNKNPLQLNMIGIWSSTLFIIFGYFLIEKLGARISGFFSSPLLFFNFFLYAQFFSEVRKVNFSTKLSMELFALGYLVSLGLFFLDLPFTYFAFPTLVAVVFPFFLASYQVFKSKTSPFTLPQIIFFFNQCAVALLDLTWNPEDLSSNSIFWGFALSLATGQIHAIIVPIVGNDAIFKEKIGGLENEISNRADELTLVRKQLWESNKNATIGRIAGGLAHEFNSALSLINIQAALIEKKMNLKALDDTFIKDAVFRIQHNVERLSNITSSLRKIAKDEGEIPRSIHDIETVLKETLVICHERFEEKGVQVKVNIQESPVFVNINASDISHVLLQLFNNALEAIEHLQEKRISISVKNDFDTVFVEIEDSGTISRKTAEQIMEPFFTGKPVGRGIGLGLGVSQSIIDAHGGRLYLDKSSKNTKFVFTLPRSKKYIELAHSKII